MALPTVAGRDGRRCPLAHAVGLQTRVEAAERRLASLLLQLKQRGDIVDEDDPAAGSALALLSQKVSDILSILVLFESKLHASEVNAERLESNLLQALQTAATGRWAEKTTAQLGQQPFGE